MRRKKLIFYSLAVLITVIATIYLVFHFETQAVLSKNGYVEMNVDKIGTDINPYVQLKGECSLIDIYISPEQAYAIEQGIQGLSYRPGTHDTLVNILDSFDIKLILVKVTKLEDSTYFAELALQRWNYFLILDIRPSDAIATAVRTGMPIYVNEALVTKTC